MAGHDGYEVSNLGRVRSLDRVVVKGNGVEQPWRGQLLAPFRVGRGGYQAVHLGRVTRTVHQLVAEAFVEPRPVGLEVRHRNGNVDDNRPSNITWGTHAENMVDRVEHGRHNLGRRTHCPRQHPLEPPNLVPSSLKRGQRTCLACVRARTFIRDRRRAGGPHGTLQEESDRYFTGLVAV